MNPKLPMPIKVSPFRHQRDAFDFACGLFGLTEQPGLRSPGCGLLCEMGTGKSLMAIAVAGALYNAGRVHRALVVAPLSVLGVWREEFAKFAGFDYMLTILTGALEKKADTLRRMSSPALQVAAVNYESVWRMGQAILSWHPDLIIADEGHKLKAPGAMVSKFMHRFGAAASYRLLLTGTPVVNKPIDVFSQYKFLAPSIFGNSFYAFRGRYFDMTGYGRHVPVMKEAMLPEFTRRLHSIAFRATKAQCLDLPETVDIIRPVELEPAAMKVYRDLVKDSFARLGEGEISVTNVLTRLLRLTQLTGGFLGDDTGCPPRPVSTAKLDALADIVDEAVYEGRKLVIMARFIPELDAICSLLDKHDVGHVCIRGGVGNRAELVAAFQKDPGIMVFVGQIAAAGLGLTLTESSTMVFYSLDYNAANHEQARARIHRAGQRNRCSYVYIQAQRTVDEKVLKALRGKADLARLIIDDCRRGLNPFDGEVNENDT